MKTFRGRIVAADASERTMTIFVETLSGVSGVVMGEEVTVSPVPEITLKQWMDAEDVRMNAMLEKPERQPGE